MSGHWEAVAAAAAAAANERARTAHERVACPKCRSSVGDRCRRRHATGTLGDELKHSHAERLRADGIALR